MQWIEQSTSITIRIGPFLDEDDGKTAETALTIGQADIRLSKNGGDFAQSNDSGGATHDEFGWYYLTLDATDTNTVGRLIVAIHESGALPVWREFMVVSSNVWDSLIGGTDYLQADAVQIEGSDATNQINAEVSDVLKTDTIAEMAQQQPPTTPTFEEAVMYLFMALRNQIDVDSSNKEFHDDAGTVIWKKAVSDNGTTYTEAKGVSGP